MTYACFIYSPLASVIGVQHIQQNAGSQTLRRDLCNIIYESRFMFRKNGNGKQETKRNVEIQHFLSRLVWVWAVSRRKTHMTSFRA